MSIDVRLILDWNNCGAIKDLNPAKKIQLLTVIDPNKMCKIVICVGAV